MAITSTVLMPLEPGVMALFVGTTTQTHAPATRDENW